MRRRLNGFDIFIILVVVLGLLFLVRKGLHKTGVTVVQHQVEFILTSAPTQNSVNITKRMKKNGLVNVNAAGTWIPMGPMTSFSIGQYQTAVATAKGQLVIANDPLERVIHMVITAQAVLTGKQVTINGNPFSVGQSVLLQEGGAVLSAQITDERVK